MSVPDPSTTDPTLPVLPSPAAGAGSADLATESNDPGELRALLERARERLSFYESFDRIIAENLRRTGEMMMETVALREQAAEDVRKRHNAGEALEAERQRSRALLEGVLAEVRTVQPVIDAMVARLQGTLDEMGSAGQQGPASVSPTVPEPMPVEIPPVPEPERLTPDVPDIARPDDAAATLTEEPPLEIMGTDTPAPEPSSAGTPSSIEILAHNVPSAATAIGLQQMLRELDVISRVDTREFADGELRLHLECTGAIPDESFTDWLARNSGSLVSCNAKAIELSFS